jgi:hypothetical protein
MEGDAARRWGGVCSGRNGGEFISIVLHRGEDKFSKRKLMRQKFKKKCNLDRLRRGAGRDTSRAEG